MPKRKNLASEEISKKQKIGPEPDSGESKLHLTKDVQKTNLQWSKSEIVDLLARIEEKLPEDDSLSYSTRLEMINWEEVAFKTHSSKECKEMWSDLYKPIRKFRLLREIVTDMKELVRNPKEKNHPDRPKKPLNSYMLFVEEKRQEVMNENPGLTSNDVAIKLGQMYRELPPNVKGKYEADAKVGSNEYLEKLQIFKEKNPDLIPKKTKRNKPLVFEEGEAPPSKPKTPFELFLKIESEKEGSETSRFTMTQKCRGRWNKLDDNEKYFWISWAEEQYEMYLQELKEYIKIHPNYEPEKLKSILNKKEKKIKEHCSGKPVKPPQTPYHLFSKMIFESEEVANINNKELMYYISEKWKACAQEEKNEYKIRNNQMWEEYRENLVKYIITLPPEDRDRVQNEKGIRRNKTEKKTETVAKQKPKVKLNKPEMPPSTKYKYFLSVYKGKKDGDEVWKNMSSEKKEEFQLKLDEEKHKYTKLYEEYLKSLTREELQELGATSLGHQSDSSDETESESD